MPVNITTRAAKGAPLTHQEMDDNLLNLKDSVDTASTQLASGETPGLMSPGSFTKLESIEAGANLYVHPTTNGNLHVPYVSQSDVGAFLRAKDHNTGTSEWVDVSWNMIANRPLLGTAATYNVSSSGNAALNEVVLGSDTRIQGLEPGQIADHIHTIDQIQGIPEDFDVQSVVYLSGVTSDVQTQLDSKIGTDLVGQPYGVAGLDGNGKVPSTQLPSYVDDVLEFADLASLPTVGESGVLYVTLDSGSLYRWSGTTYIEVASGSGVTIPNLIVGDGTTGQIAVELTTQRLDFVAGSNVNIVYNDTTNTVEISTTGTLTGNAETASRLLTPRNISATGDASWTVAFDGSSDVTSALTLSSVGTAGTYTKITTYSKGRVTSGTNLIAGDIPALDAAKIASGVLSTSRLGTGTASVSTYLRGDGTWSALDTSAGTVSSVGLSLPSMFTVTGSPVTSSGTLTATLASQSAGLVFASPSGASGVPSFRGLAASDIPALDAAKIASGVLSTSRLGTGTADVSTYLRGDGTWATVSSGTSVTLSNDTTTDSSFNLTFTDQNTGTVDSLTVSDSKLNYNPSTGQLNATAFNSSSDRSLKTNIRPLSYGLDAVMQSNPVNFDWVAQPHWHSIGFIAQELADVVPEAVDLRPDGKRGINYSILVSVAFQAIKEQQSMINTLTEELNNLKNGVTSK